MINDIPFAKVPIQAGIWGTEHVVYLLQLLAEQANIDIVVLVAAPGVSQPAPILRLFGEGGAPERDEGDSGGNEVRVERHNCGHVGHAFEGELDGR